MTATVAAWITYAADRGVTVADDAASAQALVRASDYITAFYVDKFYPVTDPLPDPLPDAVDAATYIAAGLELTTPNFFSKTYTPDQQKVLTEVKGIKWQVTGQAKGAAGATPVSTMIDALLSRYMGAGSGAVGGGYVV